MQYVIRMGAEGSTDSSIVGGKFAVLSQLSKAGFNIPPGYGLTRKAFEDHVKSAVPNELLEEFYSLAGKRDFLSPEFSGKSDEIRGRVKCALSQDMAAQVLQEYDSLVSDRRINGEEVAVRSSGIFEDSVKSSSAGQFETELYVTRKNLLDKVASVFSSYFRKDAVKYSIEEGLNLSQGALPACVLRMVPDIRTSVIVFTRHPMTKSTDTMYADFTWGQGEALVSGNVTGDNATYDKKQRKVLKIMTSRKNKMSVRDGAAHKRVAVPEGRVSQDSCTEDELYNIFETAQSIEKNFGCPQDIEMAISGDPEDPFNLSYPSRVWVLQARPITT